MTVSNVRRMSKSSEVDGGGTSATAAPIGLAEASLEVVPIKEGGGVVPEDSTLGCVELSFK